MRRLFALLLSVLFFGMAGAGNYPGSWKSRTSDNYIYAIEEDSNEKALSQSLFLNALLDRARLNVAKQISMHIQDVAEMVKTSLNGCSGYSYTARTTYSTDASMKLLHTETAYNEVARQGFAMAWLDKSELCAYWSQEIEKVLLDLNQENEKALKLIKLGYKEKAKSVLEQLQGRFSDVNEPLVWLRTFSCPQNQYEYYLSRFSVIVRTTQDALLSLGHGITIFIDCKSDCFGNPYLPLLSQLKSQLANEDRSFVDDPLEADWLVKITATAREGNTFTMDGRTSYFSYVDATISIIKAATVQTIYSNAWSEKGGDTRDFTKAALDAFKRLLQPLSKAIENNIKE